MSNLTPVEVWAREWYDVEVFVVGNRDFEIGRIARTPVDGSPFSYALKSADVLSALSDPALCELQPDTAVLYGYRDFLQLVLQSPFGVDKPELSEGQLAYGVNLDAQQLALLSMAQGVELRDKVVWTMSYILHATRPHNDNFEVASLARQIMSDVTGYEPTTKGPDCIEATWQQYSAIIDDMASIREFGPYVNSILSRYLAVPVKPQTTVLAAQEVMARQYKVSSVDEKILTQLADVHTDISAIEKYADSLRLKFPRQSWDLVPGDEYNNRMQVINQALGNVVLEIETQDHFGMYTQQPFAKLSIHSYAKQHHEVLSLYVPYLPGMDCDQIYIGLMRSLEGRTLDKSEWRFAGLKIENSDPKLRESRVIDINCFGLATEWIEEK